MGGDAARIQSLTQHQSQKVNLCALQSLFKAIQECGVLTMVEYLQFNEQMTTDFITYINETLQAQNKKT